MVMATQMTTRELEMYGCMTMQPEHQPTNDGYCSEMAGCKGDTYADKKVDLLHQLGFRQVTADIFANCKSETEIDKKAHSIIFA
jgi:hypothetical protein